MTRAPAPAPSAPSSACEAVIASALGVAAGAAIALVLARLAVDTIRAVAALASGSPPLVTVDPAAELVLGAAPGWPPSRSRPGWAPRPPRGARS